MLGAPSTPDNLKFLEAWQQGEGGTADNNPFNTTQPGAGASNYNSVGVKNYPSLAEGLKETVATLLNGRYGNIVGDLRSGKAPAMKLAQDVAASPWGTGSLVEKVLGGKVLGGKVLGGKVTVPPAGTSGAPAPSGKGAQVGASQPTGPAGTPDVAQLLISQLLQQTANFAQGKPMGTSPNPTLNAIAMLKASQPTMTDTPAVSPSLGKAQPKLGTPSSAPTPNLAGLKITGQTQGLKSSFLKQLEAAAKTAGASELVIDSGLRSPDHNAAVGGVSHSNHLTGDAADGFLVINGSKVPLGVALKAIATKFGLRSGDQPGFFNGGPDLEHVDDGFNQR
jgi:hypothetical protein